MGSKKKSNVVDITNVIEETKKAISKAKKSSKTTYPKVVEGTHLTVYTYEDGSTKLEWDDEQLLKEVREAIASVTPASKKSKKFNYSEPKEITLEDGRAALQVTVTKKTPAKKSKIKKQ